MDQADNYTISMTNNGGYSKLLCCFLILPCCVLLPFAIILIPQHNLVEFPEYWYETMIIANLSLNTYFVFISHLRYKTFFRDIKSLISVSVAIKIFLATSITYNTMYCICYLVWTHGLGYRHPIPFLGAICFNVMLLAYLVVIWSQFPNDLEMKRKIRSYLFYCLWLSLNCIEKVGLTMVFMVLPTNTQALMAIILPITREFHFWVLGMLRMQSTGTENREAKVLTDIEVNCNYSLFVAIILGTVATEVTSYCILFLEFILNLYSCYKIIKLGKKIDSSNSENDELQRNRNDTFEDLIMVEVLEVLVPLAYALSIILAYFGPNSRILGNIRNSYWTYQEIEDLSLFMKAIFTMFFIDLLSAILGGIILWKFSNLNFLKECCKTIRFYWPILVVQVGGGLVKV